MKHTFDQYLKDRSYSLETIEQVNRTVRRYRTWLKDNNSSVYLANHKTAIQYIDYMRSNYYYKPITINLKLAHLRHYYNFLSTSKNPFYRLNVRGQKRKVSVGCLSEDELLVLYMSLPETTALEQRVKLLAGLYIFQGMATTDVLHLKSKHFDDALEKVIVPQTQRSNSRVLLLHPVQRIHLAKVLPLQNKESYLIHAFELAHQPKWIITHLHQSLKGYPSYKSLSLIRQSVVQNWLKRHNLRQVQYMSGHRYITSTEKFLGDNYESLRMIILEKHPLG